MCFILIMGSRPIRIIYLQLYHLQANGREILFIQSVH